jgi:uncharacterized protein
MAVSQTRTHGGISGPSTLIGQVFGLLAIAMGFTAMGAYFAPRLSTQALQIGALGALISWLVLFLIPRLPSLVRLGIFYVFSVCQGLALGSAVNSYVARGQGEIITLAAVVTGCVVLALSIYAWTTKRSFAGWSGWLFMGLIGVLVASVLGFFISAPLFHFVLAWATAIVFGGYLLQHVQRLKSGTGSAIGLAIGIYFDVLNLFWAMLRMINATRRM